MDKIKSIAAAVAGLAFACMGQPIRSYVGIGAAFPSMHTNIRGNSGTSRAGNGRHAGRPHGHVVRNVYWGEDSLHRPWAGSISYERKREEADARSAAHQARQETESMLRLMNAEADAERRRQASERRQAEQREMLAAAKAEVRDQRRQRAAAHQAFLQEQTDEIRRRAAEQESLRVRRLAEQEAEHDRILAALKPCRAYNDDGSACTRKANPGLSFCHLHVGYSGRLQPIAEKAVGPVAEPETPTRHEPTVPKEEAASAQAPAPGPVAVQPIVVQAPAADGGSSFERSLILLATVLAMLVCLATVACMMFSFFTIRRNHAENMIC